MSLLEKLLNSYLERVSAEEKARLVETMVDRFFSAMPPEEKQHLLERLLPKLFEGVDTKAVLTSLLTALWQGSNPQTEERAGIFDAISKTARDAGGKLVEIMPDRIKKLFGEEAPPTSASPPTSPQD